MTNDFPTIDLAHLEAVWGGDGNPNPPPDFTTRYANTIKDDWNGAQRRANAATAAGNRHAYGEAARQWGAAAFDDAGLIADAIAPVRSIFG